MKRYTIEVCGVCGGQLSSRMASPGRGGSDPATGRCGVDRNHWSVGGVLLDVTPLPASEQHPDYAGSSRHRGLVEAGVIPPDAATAQTTDTEG